VNETTRTLRELVRRLRRHVSRPERFTDRQREALFALVSLALPDPDAMLTVDAACLLVAMDGENLRRDRAQSAAGCAEGYRYSLRARKTVS
jgi:hypothetical protein